MFQAERDGSNEYNSYQPGSLNTTDQLISDLDNIDIVFHIGDITYANGYISQWDQFTSQVEPIASTVPYMLARFANFHFILSVIISSLIHLEALFLSPKQPFFFSLVLYNLFIYVIQVNFLFAAVIMRGTRQGRDPSMTLQIQVVNVAC